MQHDRHRRPAVRGDGHLFDGVVDELSDRGVAHVQAQVHCRTQSGVRDVVEFGDVGGGITHGRPGPFPWVR